MSIIQVLRWVKKAQRWHGEANSRFGHHYEDAIHEGFIRVEPSEVFMNAGYRDVRQRISLTPAGMSAVNGGTPQSGNG
ncbi:MAG: hypothetical protein Unbinned3696contig1008_5 [Prokaryotic dsDNA virus sp.]|nr:MAG: hypothetical protein Unbinned3696contig1008_5 [Prokaryotic dsDNA virus sp.]|tara:strand:+ start:142 stop:375 length:234 start_codon:yes stop_codon:yes gene_type:complete